MLLYGAFAVHFVLALWSVYERRTFRLPPLELLRIALGFTLPIMLIGHAANTRLAWELFGMPSDYARVVATLWFTDTQGMQLGVMAPGWVHGCLGLHFLLNRRPLYRKLRYVLFAFALLIPVFSALGFIAMARELAGSTAAAAAVADYLAPEHAAKLAALAQWRNGLLLGYFGLIGAIFVARAVRNALERGRRHLITISYPGRTVRVPRGWSVLEASRSFHLPHASMCGGRARCSTCRVRVSAGEECLPARGPRRAQGARPHRRAARRAPRLPAAPAGRPVGDPAGAHGAAELSPDRAPAQRRARGRRALLRLPQSRRARGRSHAAGPALRAHALYRGAEQRIRAARGMLSYIELDSLCALFGLERDPARAARQALQAAGAIEKVMAELNERLGRQWNCKVTLAVSIHLGRAVVGEIGAFDPPAVIAIGEAVDATNELRKAAAAHGAAFAISQAVYAAAGVDPPAGEEIMVASPTAKAAIPVVLSAAAPALPAAAAPGLAPRAALQRLWGQ